MAKAVPACTLASPAPPIQEVSITAVIPASRRVEGLGAVCLQQLTPIHIETAGTRLLSKRSAWASALAQVGHEHPHRIAARARPREAPGPIV